MKKITHLLTLILLLSTISIKGQTPEQKTEERPYIEVTGTAEKEVIPDEIYIGIVIREKYVSKNKVTIEEQEEKLKAAIKTLGIDLKNLSLSDANADYVRVRWTKKDVLTKKEYTLMVSDATTVGQVFQELEKLEITDASVSRVSHSKQDSLKKEVKIMAMNAAKEKADYLLAAIGEQTGKPLIINEREFMPGTFHAATVNVRGNRSNTESYYIHGVKVSGENEIQFQKIKIQTTIYAKFSIK